MVKKETRFYMYVSVTTRSFFIDIQTYFDW